MDVRDPLRENSSGSSTRTPWCHPRRLQHKESHRAEGKGERRQLKRRKHSLVSRSETYCNTKRRRVSLASAFSPQNLPVFFTPAPPKPRTWRTSIHSLTYRRSADLLHPIPPLPSFPPSFLPRAHESIHRIDAGAIGVIGATQGRSTRGRRRSRRDFVVRAELAQSGSSFNSWQLISQPQTLEDRDAELERLDASAAPSRGQRKPRRVDAATRGVEQA